MYGFVITTAGEGLLARAAAGETLTLTGVKFGSGVVASAAAAKALTALISEQAAGTSSTPAVSGGQLSLIAEYRNDLSGGLADGFTLAEFGVFAKVGDDTPTLLYYAALGDKAQAVQPYSEGLDVHRFPVAVAVTGDVNVTLSYPASAWVTSAQLEEALAEIDLSGYLKTDQVGAANGAASLDESGKVPSDQLPEMNYAPASHASQHASGGSDEITPAAIGAVAVGDTVNPNLLDNWYFCNPVDQRGGYVVPPGTAYYSDTGLTTQAGAVSAYTKAAKVNSTYGTIAVSGTTYYVAWSAAVRGYVGAGYTIDRWRTYVKGTVLITDDGVHLIDTIDWGTQIELNRVPINTPVTLSVLTNQGIGTVTHTFSGVVNEQIYVDVGNGVKVNAIYNWDNSNTFLFCLQAVDSVVKGAKLELGDKQTLAHQDADGNWVLNEIPNYNEEFLKCIQSTADTYDTYANKQILHTGNMNLITPDSIGAVTWTKVLEKSITITAGWHNAGTTDYSTAIDLSDYDFILVCLDGDGTGYGNGNASLKFKINSNVPLQYITIGSNGTVQAFNIHGRAFLHRAHNNLDLVYGGDGRCAIHRSFEVDAKSGLGSLLLEISGSSFYASEDFQLIHRIYAGKINF